MPLCVCAIALDLIDAQVAVCAVTQTHRSAGTADFFHRNHVREVAHACSAVLFTHRDAQHAKRAHFLPQVGGEQVVFVNVCGARCDFTLRKVAYRVAQRVNVFAELKVQAGQVCHEDTFR